MRTQDEIVARIEAVAADDAMGFRCEVLVLALDYEHAKPYLLQGVTVVEWAKRRIAPDAIRDGAETYYDFALTKIEGHRGISAYRSVEKLTEYAWLLGQDDAVAAIEAAAYPQYGAPKVRAFGQALGLPWPEATEMRRMSAGLPCQHGCPRGCDA